MRVLAIAHVIYFVEGQGQRVWQSVLSAQISSYSRIVLSGVAECLERKLTTHSLVYSFFA